MKDSEQLAILSLIAIAGGTLLILLPDKPIWFIGVVCLFIGAHIALFLYNLFISPMVDIVVESRKNWIKHCIKRAEENIELSKENLDLRRKNIDLTVELSILKKKGKCKCKKR